MKRVMFICLGNICRSPMAEFVMRDLVEKQGLSAQISVASAATSREEEGSPTYYATQEKLRREGIPTYPRRATVLTGEDANQYDYFVCMDEGNVRRAIGILGEDNADKVCLLLSFAGQMRAVADPWYTRDFDKAYDDILLGCKALLAHLQEEL